MSVGIACQARVRRKDIFGNEYYGYCDNNARGTRVDDDKKVYLCGLHLRSFDRRAAKEESDD